jgi:pyruvate/2-oxoglutarate dehydrogenase complex dihydrolipoamide dehydrogenase (E3) component
MSIETCHNLLIGSGYATKYLAWTLGQLGQKTVIIERSLVGGSCPNVACMPSKNVIHSAKVASLLRRAAEFGITTGPVVVDMVGVLARKRSLVDELVAINRQLFEQADVELIMGHAKFAGPKVVEVSLNAGGTRTLQGDRVFLGVGTRASIPDVPGLVDAMPMTHVEALNLERLPEHLVVLGGGYVGLEFAEAMRRFGSRVTVVHRGPQLLVGEDPDMAEAVLELLRAEGVEVLLNTQLSSATGRSGERLLLKVQSGSTTTAIEASDLLVATGREPNTRSLGLEKAGVEINENGYIRVDAELQTTAPEVWAMGECAGSPHFSHAAFDDYRVVRDNLTGGKRTTQGRLIPFCLFTDPELARVGLNETQAIAAKVKYRLAKMPMAHVLRAKTLSETRGLIKALISDDDRILGFSAFGVEASELMSVAQTAMLGNLPYMALRDAIFTHPTAAEAMGKLFSQTPVSPVS